MAHNVQPRGPLNDFERTQVRRTRTAAASPLGCCCSCCCMDDCCNVPRRSLVYITYLMSATLIFMLGFWFLRTPIAQSLGLVYLTLQCGQSSFALALCAAASALFKASFPGPRGVGSTERAHRLISRSGGSSESFVRTWHDRWNMQLMQSHVFGWFLVMRSTERPSK